MSFTFQWPRFSAEFHENAIQLLNNALNKGDKPPVIADRIEVVELEMGTQPPELEIRDIGDLTMTQFRGIFRFTYAGDAHIVLRTKIQANPLYHKKPDIHLMGGTKGMVAANQPLIVPMLLRLSNFKLSSYVVLVVSKQKGITLVFKTDPLQNVDINSTFDSFTVVQKFIQKEIEGQLRQMFREDLPSIIHRVSQQWIKKSTTVEAPYLERRSAMFRQPGLETMSNPDFARARPFTSGLNPYMTKRGPLRLPQSSQRILSSSRSVSSKPSLANIHSAPSIPEFSYDQETGTFRPEIPEPRAFSHLGRIHRESRGLADLAEEESEFGGTDGDGSFDVVDWDDAMTDIMPPRSEMSVSEYESIPAVGGGIITRPRVYHASSLLHQTPSASTTYSRGPSSPSPMPTAPILHRMSQSLADVRQSSLLSPRSGQLSSTTFRRTSWDNPSPQDDSQSIEPLQFHSYQIPTIRRTTVKGEVDGFPFGDVSDIPPLVRQHSGNGQSSLSSNPSTSAAQLDTTSSAAAFDRAKNSSRRSSVSSQAPPFSSFSSDPGDPEGEPKIVLRPGINNAVSQLSLLNRSNHTLSPYTRPLEHFMIRSVPPKTTLSREGSQNTVAERQPVKAKRKRTYRLGGGNVTKTSEERTSSPPDAPPETTDATPRYPSSAASDIDVSEIDRYFRSRDEYSPRLRSGKFEPLPLSTAHLQRRLSVTQRNL